MNCLFRIITTFSFAMVCCIGFTACSDDDDNKNDEGNPIITIVHPEKVFKNGLPKSVLGMTITQNKEGLVTKITTQDGEKAVFEYGCSSTRSEQKVNQARIIVTDKGGDVTQLNLLLNHDGFVKACHSIDHAGTPEADTFTWEMKYDEDGHLIEMKRSESDGELTKITYKNGDVVATSTQSFLDFGGEDINGDGKIDNLDVRPDTEIQYTSDEITTPIENKGCLMMFDELLDVDMDEMIYAYYGGMLGIATKHLPLKQRVPNSFDADGFHFIEYTCDWTLNSQQYPIQLTIKSKSEGGSSENNFSFFW